MRFWANSGGIQHRVISSVCHLIGADGQTDGQVTITSLPKLLGLIGNHGCLRLLTSGFSPFIHSRSYTTTNKLSFLFFLIDIGHVLPIKN